ncbi:MAG: transporter substrate-binding domain-containing protein [Pseudodesulfovibrio sp.]|uniref:Extracellular solute-binding protein family 3 n=1 Tax=Pseudodesulfovibrio aespoeensis (strain ATCC 700646 / DSM 10631 / Aspo-2) TaxID=643562 RepID=E6VY88_PSEA9|nr:MULTISPECIES: transporter substrate-binding domain-containing protein [Pseudodesulfovibrio]MBU4192667.1 transporter substrate-binding domain-containing protein [Pseudomonadota bacterium]ADU61546.1 extracellular solute-binding protein family 3 [Pseudodesulfovibrio aespoeensis Aspo-2]MBU4243097.1 transporter substrate-binding domain-containing protein [Pseudomonadota bacterium]MBU4377490.1 transporter substrate-binding domain-containing protein [Pseudomonadota bacterium]MBU4474633.1 transport
MPATRCPALPFLLCALLLGQLLCCPRALAGGVHVMTEQYPPFSYQVDGEARGFCVELVQRILERLGLGESDIVFYPWARAYMKLKEEDGHVLFPMSRSVERDGLFRFVGPVFDDTLYFFRRKGSAVQVQGLADARRVGAIGVTRDDFYHQFLVEHGFANLDISVCQLHDFRKLAQGRVDLVPMGEKAMSGFMARQQGLDPAMFEKAGPAIYRSEVFIGFSGSTPDEVVESWQKALDELKEAGVYGAIMNRYFPPDTQPE